MAAKKKDLPAKKTVKGGRLAANDNLTLVHVWRARRRCRQRAR